MSSDVSGKCLVLTSGGLDSTVLLYKAIATFGKSNVYMLNMYYGQKHSIEIEMARWQAKHLGLEDHYIEKDISTIFNGLENASALLLSDRQPDCGSPDKEVEKSGKV